MTINIVYPPRPRRRARVIALHCSGAGAAQWDALAAVVSGRYELATPEHYGCASVGMWPGAHAFTLADEAARTLALIDDSADKVHLVGHSYGGGVALHVALARPEKIAGIALYEPSAFHLLRQLGARGAEAEAEIAAVARRFAEGVLTGDYRGAIAAFVDYWCGSGAWDATRPAAQDALIRWAPKGPLDFRALLDEPTPLSAYGALDVPVLILRGEHAPQPARVIADCLAELLPASRLTVVADAGHMGPLTHASAVASLIAQHIIDAEIAARPRRARAA